MCEKKNFDITVVYSPPQGYSNKTDTQYICGIKISWRREGN